MSIRPVSGYSWRGRQIRQQAVRNVGTTLPPPMLGWNRRDPIGEMDPEYAYILDNWFPGERWLQTRRGSRKYATGLGAPVDTVMSWVCCSAAPPVMFAAAGGSIFDVSAQGPVGAAAVSSLQSDRWSHTIFSTSSNINYLYCVNGVDSPRYFNGTSWVTPTITGSDATKFSHVNSFAKRLIFVIKNSMKIAYLDVDSIQGTASEFNFSSLTKKGGRLVATGTWTRDGGDGIDDLFVAVTSEGEAIIYQGTDPSSSNTWSLVGVFNIAPPIGERCMIKLGGELIIMTQDGFSQLSRFLATDRAIASAAMSDPINPVLKEAVYKHKDNFGWQPIFYPASRDTGAMLIFNIPHGTENVQFVSNSSTGAWCRFRGLNARCWEIHDDRPFFGDADGNVWEADYGFSDDGAAIVAEAQQAYSYFGQRIVGKKFNFVRPHLITDGPVTATMSIGVDHQSIVIADDATFSDPSGATWDVSEWDEEYWAGEPAPSLDWQAAGGIGLSAAVRWKISSAVGQSQWTGTNWLYEPAMSVGFL